MKLLKPTYRLSRIKFSLFTLAYCVVVLVVGFIISVTGGSGGWIGPLVHLAMLLLYLYYIAVPAPSVLVLYPDIQSGSHGWWRRIRDGTGHLAALVIFLGALLTTFASLMMISTCFVSAWGGCSYPGAESAMVGERETVKTAIMSMMVDKELSHVRASTSGHGGEKIRSTGTQFHDTITLHDYMDPAATQFCYRWDADGRITFQYNVDDNANCAIDAKQLFP